MPRSRGQLLLTGGTDRVWAAGILRFLHIRVRQLDDSKVVLAESPHLHRLHYLLGPLSGAKAFSSESQNQLPVLNWIQFYVYSTQWQQQPPQGTKIKNLYRLQWFRKTSEMLMFIFPVTHATLHQMNQKSTVTGTRGLRSTKYKNVSQSITHDGLYGVI